MTEKGRYADGGGLYLQVSAEGTKSWLFRFTLDRRPRQMGLGPLHTVSLSDARQKALICRKLLLEGIDPIEDRNRRRLARQTAVARSKPFEWCARAYIAAHEAGWTNLKHAAQWTSTLETYAFPVLGKLPVADIDTSLVMRVVEPIWKTKTETASRVRQRIEKILDWAKVLGYREGDNPARWRGNLDNLLPAKSKVHKVKHHAALPYTDAGAFMAALRTMEGVSARGLEFLILTAARVRQVRKATWDEIDFGKAEWTIPADHMKARRQHVVPLSDEAVSVLRKMEAIRESDHVFPGQRKRRPLSNGAFDALLERMKRDDLTSHGFRSTFKDWTAERTNYQNEVGEMALAHVVKNKVEAAYRRGDLRDKRRRLMEDWAEYLSITEEPSSNVVPMQRDASK